MMAEIKRALIIYLDRDKHTPTLNGNYRNGHGSKTIIMDNVEIGIATPRERDSTFKPMLIPKHQRTFKGFDEKIISMYERGMSTRDIQSHLQEMYGMEVSHELIANASDAVVDEVEAWQHRPLEQIYLDGMIVKVRDGKQVVNKTLHIAMGVNMEGNKEILGL
ncbi:transposase [Alphaproteobacteria bacterium]